MDWPQSFNSHIFRHHSLSLYCMYMYACMTCVLFLFCSAVERFFRLWLCCYLYHTGASTYLMFSLLLTNHIHMFQPPLANFFLLNVFSAPSFSITNTGKVIMNRTCSKKKNGINLMLMLMLMLLPYQLKEPRVNHFLLFLTVLATATAVDLLLPLLRECSCMSTLTLEFWWHTVLPTKK